MQLQSTRERGVCMTQRVACDGGGRERRELWEVGVGQGWRRTFSGMLTAMMYAGSRGSGRQKSLR